MKTISLLMFVILLASCNKDTSTQIHPNSFIFGYCYCYNCMSPQKKIWYYEISGNNIYPDSMTEFPGPEIFATTPLANNKYVIASALINNFPQFLQSNPNQTYGNIDCSIHSAYHIEYVENGQLRKWDIDRSDTTQQPQAIRAYLHQMDSVFQQLRY